MALDVLPGCAGLAAAADAACGGEDGFAGVSEAELAGLVCAWDRVEAHAAARKLAAIAELGRRDPGRKDAEFTADQLACALADSRGHAGALLDLARILWAPGCPARRRRCWTGYLPVQGRDHRRRHRAAGPARGGRRRGQGAGPCRGADPGRAARRDRPRRHGGRPGKARQRRETAPRDARVERWIEDSGNAALMGCELPPDEVLAADQRITAWAHELNKAGLDGGMDQLRARAYLDLLLGRDSRPRPCRPVSLGRTWTRTVRAAPGGPLGSAVPAGFAGRVTLTAPLATLTVSRAGRAS